jgi:hypothetical protein
MDQFRMDKHYLSNLLNPYSDLLLFPKTLCETLTQCGKINKRLAKHMQDYNLYLLLLRKYHKDIRKLKRFGYIFNTYTHWENTIKLAIYRFLVMKQRILDTFKNIDKNDASLLRQYNINNINLNNYMSIHKLSCEYLLCQDDEVYNIDYKDIIELLPAIPTISRSNRRETKYIMHLETSDTIVPIQQRLYSR